MQDLRFLHRQRVASGCWKVEPRVSECCRLAWGGNLQRAKESGRHPRLPDGSIPNPVNQQSEETWTARLAPLNFSDYRKGFSVIGLDLDGFEGEAKRLALGLRAIFQCKSTRKKKF